MERILLNIHNVRINTKGRETKYKTFDIVKRENGFVGRRLGPNKGKKQKENNRENETGG